MRQVFHNINAKEVAGVLILLMAFTITLYGIIAEPNGEIHSSVLEYNGGELPALGTICMFTATGEALTGRLTSQTDMLSKDWQIVE